MGRGTVAAALAAAGVTVVDGDATADVDVVVVAEALKPEDRAMLEAGPALVVLNKADLAGFGAGGPIAVADRRAAEYRALTGVPTVPMVGLLAAATLDDELIAALRVLTAEPADLTSTDGFLSAEHSLPAKRARATAGHPRPVRHRPRRSRAAAGHGRRRAACCAAAAQPGRPRARLGWPRAGAEVRYRRMRSALVQLRTLAARRQARAGRLSLR